LVNAEVSKELTEPQFKEYLSVIQSEKAAFDALSKISTHAFSSLSQLRDIQFDIVLFQGTRFKERNLSVLSALPNILKSGGLFIEVLSNMHGASRYEKILKQSYQAEIFSDSKRKARVFGIADFNPTFFNLSEPVLDKNQSRASFNKGELDKGSLLLAECLAGKLSGEIFEFCSGSGLLASRLTNDSPLITKCIGFESDFDSYERSKEIENDKISFQWQDILSLPESVKFKTIVVNPPFHDADGENIKLGLKIIQKALSLLKTNGNLYVVQNSHLPYLRDLKLPKRAEILSQQNGFMVWHYEA
jgi:16S rRNA (guanine1207-N2)-methyltransferase